MLIEELASNHYQTKVVRRGIGSKHNLINKTCKHHQVTTLTNVTVIFLMGCHLGILKVILNNKLIIQVKTAL